MTRKDFISQVEVNQKTVRRFLTALCCGNQELADDLAQDTFVKAYLSLDSFKEESKFITWIFRIAYNTFISHKRNIHNSLSKNVNLDDADNFISKASSDSMFDYQGLYLALEKLSDKERSAILLHYMQGYSINEIAEINYSTVDAVKKQLSRARQHLQNLLK